MRRRYRSAARAEMARSTRRVILQAATDAFSRGGFAGATVRGIAAAAAVSVPTVELHFGTKTALLKAAIDVAIAGDDEPVPMLDRPWAEAAGAASTVEEFLRIATGVLGPAQRRSAGLVVAAFEGATSNRDLSPVVEQLAAQREATARWLVGQLTARAPLRPGMTEHDAVDCVWVLIDSAIYDRVTRHRGWTTDSYQEWVAESIATRLIADDQRAHPAPPPAAAATHPSTGRTHDEH